MSQFVEVKTAELIGQALNWAVGAAIGKKIIIRPRTGQLDGELLVWYEAGDHGGVCAFAPSTNWAQGGPLLDKYQIELLTIKIGSDSVKHWCAFLHADSRKYEKGHTALIALCRAIVAAKLGDVVQVPVELVGVVS